MPFASDSKSNYWLCFDMIVSSIQSLTCLARACGLAGCLFVTGVIWSKISMVEAIEAYKWLRPRDLEDRCFCFGSVLIKWAIEPITLSFSGFFSPLM